MLNLDELDAQMDSTVPYYLPSLVQELRDTRAAQAEVLDCLREFVALYDGTRDLLGRSVTAKLVRAEAAIARAEGRR